MPAVSSRVCPLTCRLKYGSLLIVSISGRMTGLSFGGRYSRETRAQAKLICTLHSQETAITSYDYSTFSQKAERMRVVCKIYWENQQTATILVLSYYKQELWQISRVQSHECMRQSDIIWYSAVGT